MTRAVGPAVAGSWYPADPAALSDLVDRLLQAASPRDEAPSLPACVIAPHAGFAYSGEVAAHAFRPFAGCKAIHRVIVIGPSHYVGFRGGRVPFADAYRTPLGDVPLDRAALDQLLSLPGVAADEQLWTREHSLEAELPFLQRALRGHFRAVPVAVGSGSTRDDLRGLAKALDQIVDGATLIVVSSDFTHYGASFGFTPFSHSVAEGIRALDTGAIERIIAKDADGFAHYCDDTGATVCGRLAIEVALRMTWAPAPGRLLAYDTSGRMTGDWSHTVSYAAIGFGGDGAS